MKGGKNTLKRENIEKVKTLRSGNANSEMPCRQKKKIFIFLKKV